MTHFDTKCDSPAKKTPVSRVAVVWCQDVVVTDKTDLSHFGPNRLHFVTKSDTPAEEHTKVYGLSKIHDS